jgi:flagellar hook-associated protein 1 FlgK
MSDLFSMLRIASRALDAQRYGLDVTGQNIANVNTAGYTRRSVVYEEVPPLDPWSPGGGVDVQALVAARAPLLEARLMFEQPGSSREGAIADHLAVLEANLGQPGASLDAALARFYNTYAQLAQNPISATARQQVIVEGQTLSRTFNERATGFNNAQLNADRELRDTVRQVNALASQIAEINAGISSAGPDNADGLLDQQSVALASLSELVDVTVTHNADGTIDVSVGSGRSLVVGANTFALTATFTAPQGFAQIISDGAAVPTDVTTEITGGRIAGLLQLRDVLIPQYQTQLDQLAYGVATDVNTLATSGYDLSGTAGVNFFAPPSGVAGAAQQMAVNSAVVADSSLVVASATTAAGNNDIARAIAALQDQPITGTTSRPVDAWGNLVYSVASDSRSATQARASHDQVIQQLKNLKDQISGVSIDEEAAMLLKFQRSYEANAKFFQVTDQALDLLMSLVRT